RFYHYGIGFKMLHKRALRNDSVLLVVFVDVHRGKESGHITLSFLWKMLTDVPVILLSARASDRLGNVTRTRVVRCEHQIPVAKNLIHVRHVLSSGITGFQRIAAFVNI